METATDNGMIYFKIYLNNFQYHPVPYVQSPKHIFLIGTGIKGFA